MKKFLLLAGFSALVLSSCKDDDIKYWDLEILNGTWKFDKVETISGKDGKTLIVSNPAVGCDAKNTITFTSDNYKVRLQTYQGTGTVCTPFIDETANFSYDEDLRMLTFSEDNIEVEKYQVIVLSKDMLELRPMTPVADANDDNVPDFEYHYFKR